MLHNRIDREDRDSALVELNMGHPVPDPAECLWGDSEKGSQVVQRDTMH